MASDVAEIGGSVPLPVKKWEVYARERALFKSPRNAALEAGYDDRSGMHSKLERKPEVRERIAFLARQEKEVISEVRERLLRDLYVIADHDPGDFYEVRETVVGYRKNGDPIIREAQLPKYFRDMTREQRRCVESYAVTESGKPNLKLHSLIEANREIRKMLALDKPPAEASDADAEFARMTLGEQLAVVERQISDLRKNGLMLTHDGGSGSSSSPEASS
jgi:hypothetical protein